MYFFVKLFHTCWIQLRNIYRGWFPLSNKTLYTDSWLMYDRSGIPRGVKQPVFSDDEPIAVHVITQTKPDGRSDERRAILFRDSTRDMYEPASLFAMCSPPWYVITCNNEDMTSELAPYVCPGNHITRFFLDILAKGSWKYMHPKTFEELDFPSDEIVIKNAF